jgi:vitamin B12 transporter
MLHPAVPLKAAMLIFLMSAGRAGGAGMTDVTRRLALWLLASVLLPAAWAQPVTCAETAPADEEQGEEIILVTATRLKTHGEEVASSFTVITREEIERKQAVFVADLLRESPGVDVSANGGQGQQASIQIRGAKAEHTLVLIDGVEVNDPISPGRTFNVGTMTTENIERIEIIRGPQSTLYGSDAIGGVINIITRRGRGRPTVFGSAEVGSFDTYRQELGVSGGDALLNYSFGAQNSKTDGVTAAGEDYGNAEDDEFRSRSYSFRVGLTPTDSFAADFFLRHGRTYGDIDDSGGLGGDDPNHTFDTRWTSARVQGCLSLLEDRWEQVIGVSVTDLSRWDHDEEDPAQPDEFQRSKYQSRMVKFDWQHDLHLCDWNTLTLGLETEEEEGRSRFYSESSWGPYASVFARARARTNGYYVQDRIALWGSFFATVGARVDDHDEFGSETTYRIAPAYLVRSTGTKIKATWGTGFKAPTLFQLYSEYGDPNLNAEESEGWDAGVEQEFWDGRAAVGLTYFDNDIDDLIDYDTATSSYKNVARAETKGIEAFALVRPVTDLTLRATYTRTDTEDKDTGLDLIRRPNKKASVDANYRFLDRKADITLAVVYVGQRKDLDFSTWPASRLTLDSYTLVNVACSYDVSEQFQLFARLENLFNEDYEPVQGYGGVGRGVYGGVRFRF